MKRIYFVLAALIVTALVCFGMGKHRSWIERADSDPKAASRVNPFEGQEVEIKAGQKLYRRYCAACHGVDANGSFRNPSLDSPTVMNASAGELYWLLENGSLQRGMPSWSFLPQEQRWQLIAWIRSRPA